MTDIVFPEDEGTGGYPDSDVARASDFNDAAHFAAHVHAAQPHSALIDGGQISNYDAASNTITVESGIAALTEDNISGDKSGITHDSGTFVVDFDARTVSLTTSSGVNEIYLTIDLSNSDTVIVEAISDGSNPSQPAVKIAAVDTANDVVSEQWNLVTADGTLSFPDRDAATTALTSLPTGVSVIDRSNNTRITDGSLEAGDTTVDGTLEAGDTAVDGTLEANTIRIDGDSVSEKLIDTRNSINQLFIDNARQDFELGLNIIDMDDGQFEIYADDSKIADSSNVTLNLGSPVNGNGTVSLTSSATTGFTEHDIEDYGLLPNSVVVTDDVDTNPSNGTIKYEIEDENGNVVTITRSQLNQSVDVSNTIETYAVSTRAVLERNSTTDTSPVLDAYSVYISGQKPDDYLDATVQTVSEV